MHPCDGSGKLQRKNLFDKNEKLRRSNINLVILVIIFLKIFALLAAPLFFAAQILSFKFFKNVIQIEHCNNAFLHLFPQFSLLLPQPRLFSSYPSYLSPLPLLVGHSGYEGTSFSYNSSSLDPISLLFFPSF